MRRRRLYDRRRRGVWRWLLWGALLAGFVWLAGFAVFTLVVAQAEPPVPPPHADGIVVLTGGDDRVSAALGLLADRAAPLLLISGAGRGTYLGDFTTDDAAAATHFAADITVGHTAESTIGNAFEAAAWARLHQMHSLLVVTADYHMPRAIWLLHQHLPGVKLIGYPVRPPAMTTLLALSTLRLLAAEYTKYLAVRSGVAGLIFEALGVRR
ncbi:MAG: YdcF family protein [Acidocella sp.]|nr:YdcF family protein [Acidocella sp.]